VVAALDGPAGLYVHIPFCERICPFCPYNKVAGGEEVAARYFDALQSELESFVAAHADRFGVPFSSLYLGGGTPTMYPDRLERVLAALPVAGPRAIEVLPTHGAVERLDDLRRIGVTSVSIGAQSFNDRVLRRLGRPHDAAMSHAAVTNAMGRFECVDVDLIVDVEWERGGLSGAFLRDVRDCFGLGVDQVSTYPLMRFGFTPFGAATHDRRREHAVLSRATEIAVRMGYERRSVWTFNRVGSPSYSSITRRRFIGAGAGASSFTGRDFFVNGFGVERYISSIITDGSAVDRSFRLGRWSGAAYEAFWQAYAGRVDPRTISDTYGRPVGDVAVACAKMLSVLGVLGRNGRGYVVTPRGFDIYHDLERSITYRFVEPLWAEMLAEGGNDGWARPERARSGLEWRVARRLYGRSVAGRGPLVS
jgi:oxygen-independent coproporphyrinogen-3 oxidase